MPNVKNYFEQPGPDGNNKLVVDGSTAFGPGSLSLSGATVINDGGDPQMTFGVVDGGDGEQLERATLYMANEGFDAAGDQNGNTVYGCFAGNQVDTNTLCAYVGISAGEFHTAGFNTTCLGSVSGADLTTGTNNTFIGMLAGDFTDTGSGNIAIGVVTGAGGSVDGTIYIGNNIDASPVSNVMNIGDTFFGNMDGDSQQLVVGGSILAGFTIGAQLELTDPTQGLLLNPVPNDGNLLGTPNGMIWYNTSDDEFRCKRSVGIRTITTEAV